MKTSIAHATRVAVHLLCAGTGHATACDGVAVHRATTPVPSGIASVLRDDALALAQRPAAANVVLIGDSIARRWPSNSLGRAFPGATVFNYGMDSDRTQNVLWRLSTPELTRIRPHTVVLLIGTNNLSDHEPACAITSGIQAIVERIDALWGTPALRILEVLPRGEDFGFEDGSRHEVNAGIREIARRRGRALALGADAQISCDRHPPCSNYAPDHLPLTNQGYKVLEALLGRTE